MSLRINHNPMAMNTHRNLTSTSQANARNLERLSSGLKINRGADHPANLQISERLRAQMAGVQQAISNSEQAVSMVQTAEAAMDEVSRALINAVLLARRPSTEAVAVTTRNDVTPAKVTAPASTSTACPGEIPPSASAVAATEAAGWSPWSPRRRPASGVGL